MAESNLTEQDIEVRKELFRYTDLTHPVMQTLFEIQPETTTSPTVESD